MLSLGLLTVGVMLCNIKPETCIESTSKEGSNNMVGILATLGIALSSGFASVYTEKVIKKKKREENRRGYSLAYMQVQLAGVSLVIIGVWAIGKVREWQNDERAPW